MRTAAVTVVASAAPSGIAVSMAAGGTAAISIVARVAAMFRNDPGGVLDCSTCCSGHGS